MQELLSSRSGSRELGRIQISSLYHEHMDLGTCLRQFLSGFLDFFQPRNVSVVLALSNEAYRAMGKILLLNIGFFVGGILLLNHIITPSLTFIVPSAVRASYDWIFLILWILPVCILSMIFNAIWSQKVVEETLALKSPATSVTQSTSPPTQNSNSNLGKAVDRTRDQIAESLYRAQIKFGFMIQAEVTFFLMSSLLPHALTLLPLPTLMSHDLIRIITSIGYVLYFLQYALLYGFQAFEPYWIWSSWSLDRMIQHCELYPFYVIGFGSLLSLLSLMFSFFIGSGLYGCIYPLVGLEALEMKR